MSFDRLSIRRNSDCFRIPVDPQATKVCFGRQKRQSVKKLIAKSPPSLHPNAPGCCSRNPALSFCWLSQPFDYFMHASSLTFLERTHRDVFKHAKNSSFSFPNLILDLNSKLRLQLFHSPRPRCLRRIFSPTVCFILPRAQPLNRISSPASSSCCFMKCCVW